MKAEDNKEGKTKKFSFGKWILRIFLSICLLLFLVIVAFKLPVVQKWTIYKLNNKLSEELEHPTNMSGLDIDLVDGLVLENFIINKPNSSDTLIYVDAFSFSLRESLISLLSNRIAINEINMENAQVNEFLGVNDKQSDLKVLLSKLSYTSDKDKSSDFDLRIKRVNLKNLVYHSVDKKNYKNLKVSLKKGKIIINTFDVTGNYYGFEEIYFDQPQLVWNTEKRPDTDALLNNSVNESIDEQSNGGGMNIADLFGETCLYSSIDKFSIVNGDVILKNDNQELLNFNYKNINLDMEEFYLNSDPELTFKLKDFNLGIDDLNIHKFKIDDVSITDKSLLLNNMELLTDRSYIENTVKLKYRSLDELFSFSEKVFTDITVKPCKIAVEEILSFAPSIVDLPIFANNRQSILYLDGTIKGRKNSLNFRDLNLKLGNKLSFKGDFSIKNGFNEDENLYNITIDQLLTSIDKLKSVLPKFLPPSNFLLLGNLDYKGRLDGYATDFVSYGELNTNLGRAKLDMRLDMNGRVEDALYSGEIEMVDFDLRTWSGNKDFDKINLIAQVKEGRGLVRDNAQAILTANITSMGYKSYPYRNIIFNGQLNQNKLLGQLSIDDENVVFDFNGNFELTQSSNLMDFRLIIQKMNLKNLYLSEDNMAVSGQVDVDLSGNNIEDALGSLTATKLTFRKEMEVFLFDTVSVDIKQLLGNQKSIDFYSDLADFNIKGNFKVADLPLILQDITSKNYPRYYELFNIKGPKSPSHNNQNFSYRFDVKDTKKYLNLVGLDGMRIVGAKGNGTVNMEQESMAFNLNLPSFNFKDNQFRNIKCSVKIVSDIALMSIVMDSILIKGKPIDPIRMNVKMDSDTLNWNFVGGRLMDSVGIVDIGGKIIPKNEGVEFSFFENKLELFGSDWMFEKNNGYLAKEYIEVENFVLTDGRRLIRIDDLNNKGLKLNMSNIELAAFNKMINYSKMDFFGNLDLTLNYDNIFSNGNAFVYIDVENFKINEDDYGVLSSTVSVPYKDNITGTLQMLKDSLSLDTDLFYNPTTDSLDVVATGVHLRMDIFEYLIRNGLSDVEGTIDVNSHFYGKLSDLKFDADGMVNSFKGKVDYLGAYFTAENQPVTSDRYYLDVNGLVIKDMLGNRANVKGGMRHDFYSNMVLDVDVTSDNFLLLNTTKEDNPYYYGYGIGEFDASFDGSIDFTDLKVDIVTNTGSKLFFPVHSVESDFNENFIQFVDLEDGKEVIDTIQEDLDLSGLDIEMKLKLTTDAEVSIIFDERLGDVIKGNGTGEMQLYNRRNGDFNIFGDYTIDKGQYRFTAFNGLITKPFVVNRGSNLTWTGDPLNADINIFAHYDGLRVSMYEYLQEYLTNYNDQELISDAKNKTEVDLTVNLKGSLFKPDISFDVDFPNLTGVLKSFATTKTNSLKSNEAIFNQQIASLIVTQRFLPSASSGSTYRDQIAYETGLNTLSEFVTGQFSDIVSGFLEEATSNSIWADIDVDLGVSKRSNTELEQTTVNNTYLPNEVEIRVKNKFKFMDERLSFDIGGNYFKDELYESGNLFIGDFQLEYYLTPKRNLKTRLYLKYDYEAILEQQNRRTKLGTGIAYEYEFGDMIITTKKELKGKKGKKVKK